MCLLPFGSRHGIRIVSDEKWPESSDHRVIARKWGQASGNADGWNIDTVCVVVNELEKFMKSSSFQPNQIPPPKWYHFHLEDNSKLESRVWFHRWLLRHHYYRGECSFHDSDADYNVSRWEPIEGQLVRHYIGCDLLNDPGPLQPPTKARSAGATWLLPWSTDTVI